MPRYFEIIADTAKLAREKVRACPGNVSILKEEQISKRDWSWGGFRKKTYYRIVVSEYRLTGAGANERDGAGSFFVGLGQHHHETLDKKASANQGLTRQGLTHNKEGESTASVKKSSPSKSAVKDQGNSKSQKNIEEIFRAVLTKRNEIQEARSPKESGATLFDYTREEDMPRGGRRGHDGNGSSRAGSEKAIETPVSTSVERHEQAELPIQTQTQAQTQVKTSVAQEQKEQTSFVDDAASPQQVNAAVALLAERTSEILRPHSPSKSKVQLSTKPIEKPSTKSSTKSIVQAKKPTQSKSAVRSRKNALYGVSVDEFLTAQGFSQSCVEQAIELSLVRTLIREEDLVTLAEAVASLPLYGEGLVAPVQATGKESFSSPREPHFVFMVGSTGVGKTTTLSKLAFDYARPRAPEKTGQSTQKTTHNLSHNKKAAKTLTPMYGPNPLRKNILAGKVLATEAANHARLTDEDSMGKRVVENKRIAERIAVGSCDLRRMGALAQVGSFCEALGLRLSKLDTKMRIIEFYQEHQHVEQLFVDTPGCSPKETELISEIGNILHAFNTTKTVYWCVPASARIDDLLQTWEALAPLAPERLILTKLDESQSLGAVISLAAMTGLPIDYACTGQDILSDIEHASMPVIKQRLLTQWQGLKSRRKK